MTREAQGKEHGKSTIAGKDVWNVQSHTGSWESRREAAVAGHGMIVGRAWRSGGLIDEKKLTVGGCTLQLCRWKE